MPTHRFARFELESRSDMVRTVLGAALLVGIGEPLLTAAARTMPPRDLHRLVRSWASMTIKFLDLEIDTAGLEHIDRSDQYVVAPLHEGFADPLVLSRLPLDLRYVARDELFEWPQLGRFLRASGQIVIRPEQPFGGLRSLIDESRRAFARGESVVMFPQGSILGIEAAFTNGAFAVADMLDRPLLPVVITGTHRVWEHPYTDLLRFGQTASLIVLPPIPTGRARESMRDIERKMKKLALSDSTRPARRLDPRRDGYWDGYKYEIDPDFPEIAELVTAHRETISPS